MSIFQIHRLRHIVDWRSHIDCSREHKIGNMIHRDQLDCIDDNKDQIVEFVAKVVELVELEVVVEVELGVAVVEALVKFDSEYLK